MEHVHEPGHPDTAHHRSLRELLEHGQPEIDESMRDMLRIMREQYAFLDHVRIVFVSPDDEPDTGGFFHRVALDAETYTPTVFIVSPREGHMERLFEVRRASAQRVAAMLGIEFSHMSPATLRQFIVAHEFGHAADYVKNYESNPDYHGGDAAEEWDVHYNANLLTLPVRGFDPVDLRTEAARFTNLDALLEAYPSIRTDIDLSTITTIDALLDAQEIAYRESAYERYADDFAVHFLKHNARALRISELPTHERPEDREAA